MIVRYLYSDSCEMCNDFKDVGIYDDLDRLLTPIEGIYWDPGPVGETDTSYLTRDRNGRVTRDGGVVLNDHYQRIKRDRAPDEDGNLGTPVMQLVKDRETKEFYPQFAISDSPYRIGRLLNDEPWECKRRISQRLFHHYLSFGLGLHPTDQVKVRKVLQPEKQRNQYQLTEWRDAFRKASQV